MLKLPIKISLVVMVIMGILLGLILPKINTNSKNLCINSPVKLCSVYRLVNDTLQNHSITSIWVLTNSHCPFCSLLMAELSQWEKQISINLVSKQSVQTVGKWVQQFNWVQSQPRIWHVPSSTASTIFCDKVTPIILIYSKGKLIFRNLGYVPVETLNAVIDNQ